MEKYWDKNLGQLERCPLLNKSEENVTRKSSRRFKAEGGPCKQKTAIRKGGGGEKEGSVGILAFPLQLEITGKETKLMGGISGEV